MVILLPTISWICTILATLKFQEILLPEPPIIPSLPPSKSYYSTTAPSQTPIQYNLGMLLLPPWQQSVVNLEEKYQNTTTQKKVLDSDSNAGSSVDVLESIAKDTEMVDDVGNSENEAKPNDDITEEDNIVDQEDEDEEDIVKSSEEVNDNNGLEENVDEEAETNEDQFVISKEVEEEIYDELPIDCIDEKDQDIKKEEIHALSQLLDIGDTTYTESKDEHLPQDRSGDGDNALQMDINYGEQDREEDASMFDLELDEQGSVIDQDTPVEIISSEEIDEGEEPMPLTIEEVDIDAVSLRDEQYPNEPLTIDEEEHETEVRSTQEDDQVSLTSNEESEEVAIHIDEETEDDNIEEVMRDDESSQIIHEQTSDRNKSVNAAVVAAAIEEILKNGGEVVSPPDYHTPQQTEITSRSLESIRVVTANIATVFIILPFIYSLAVHIFLSSFHERPFSKFNLWSPIVFRAIAALIITLEIYRQVFMLPEDNLIMIGMGILFNIMTTFGSMFLIYQTRCQEIDGPMPTDVSLENKVVFITGGNSGIGLETARQLYQRGATILLGCRSEARAIEAIQSIDPSYAEENIERRRLHYINIDLTSMASVHQAVQAFDKMNMPLHTLILNAGVMRNKREETVDGLEMTMAANHLGHFLLTNLLLPKLRATAQKEDSPSRIITVSSSLYQNARRSREDNGDTGSMLESGIDLSDLQCQRKEYSLFDQYAQSKLANILFALELGRREKNVNQYQPVAANTNGISQDKDTPVLKRRKKIRPKLTPSTAEEQEHDEDDELGFSDVVSTPTKKKKIRKKLVPISTSEEKKDEDTTTVSSTITTKKKRIRPKLTPVSPAEVPNDDDSDGDDLLGFGEYMPTPPSRSTKKVISSSSHETAVHQTLPYPQDSKVDALACLVKSICLHPGLVRTNVVRDMPGYLFYPNKVFSLFMMMLQKSPHSGAYTSVYCVLMDEEVPNECYYVNSEPQQLAKHALDEEDAKQLWDLSSELVMLEKSTS